MNPNHPQILVSHSLSDNAIDEDFQYNIHSDARQLFKKPENSDLIRALGLFGSVEVSGLTLEEKLVSS